jgi:LmbE family N-acetylglucosaminyl deacetylase
VELTSRDAVAGTRIEVILADAQSILAVSPHLDDAVLSAGATLAASRARGTRVTVFTLFAGLPDTGTSEVARRHHRRCGLPADAVAAVSLRRAEDHRAVATLGAVAVHAPLLDVVYRRCSSGAWVCESEDDLWAHGPADATLCTRAGVLIAYTAREVEADLLIAPAGLGGHVDHALTAEACAWAANAKRIRLLEWRDLPYAAIGPLDATFKHVQPGATWMGRKLEAAAFYRSQLPMLWPDARWREELGTCVEGFRSSKSD